MGISIGKMLLLSCCTSVSGCTHPFSFLDSNRFLSKVYTPKSQDITMMRKGLNSGFLVNFASGVVEKKLLDETTIK